MTYQLFNFTRCEVKVTFYPTDAHPLLELLAANSFTIEDAERWDIKHTKTGLIFGYPGWQIHEPRDIGYGISFVLYDEQFAQDTPEAPAQEPSKPVTSYDIGFIDGKDSRGFSCFIHKQGCNHFNPKSFVDHYTVTGTLEEAIESYLDAELREQGYDESIVEVFPCAEGRTD